MTNIAITPNYTSSSIWNTRNAMLAVGVVTMAAGVALLILSGTGSAGLLHLTTSTALPIGFTVAAAGAALLCSPLAQRIALIWQKQQEAQQALPQAPPLSHDSSSTPKSEDDIPAPWGSGERIDAAADRYMANKAAVESQAQQIWPGIYLGPLAVADDIRMGNNPHDIGAIVSVLSGTTLTDRPDPDASIQEMNIEIEDKGENWGILKAHFEKTFQFIDHAHAEGKTVLIHCAQGLSRSPTLLTAYLMTKLEISRDEALDMIDKHRPIMPNKGFLDGLAHYKPA